MSLNNQPVPRTRLAFGTLLAIAVALSGLPRAAHSDAPGRGLTANFEVAYLTYAIDHHFAALRMTELAAGTDATRDAALAPTEGTAPTPDTTEVAAKASSEAIRSMARKANRAQREEILHAQQHLREWYGMEHEPQISTPNRARIELLERAPVGEEFDHLFLETFSRHHFTIATRSVQCVVSADIEHADLQRFCGSILQVQMNDINDMREMLCRDFEICDYVPLRGLKGRHTGDEDELGQQDGPVTLSDDETE